MTMKQTQTKMFDFSDVGLDFCAGSKNLFPDRFKKMLSLGYNEQTVASVAVTGNQVVLTYGVSHGYVADRVLKITSGALAAINDGEFWIDAVTANTVTLTIDDAPISVAGGFVTKIASLGWSLEYENSNIHVYKLKALDESNVYLRLCFQNNLSLANYVSPCLGDTFDQATGFITDADSISSTKNINTPNLDFHWMYSGWATSNDANYNYQQGYPWWGKGVIIGSAYHFVSMHQHYNSGTPQRLCGVLPVISILSNLKKHIIIGEKRQSVVAGGAMIGAFQAFIGDVRVALSNFSTQDLTYPVAVSGVLPDRIDGQNTTMCRPLLVSEYSTRQFLGVVMGAYEVCYGSNNIPILHYQNQPNQSKDIDLNNNVFVQTFGSNAWWCVPVEEIKIA